jgi:hypothetical protein
MASLSVDIDGANADSSNETKTGIDMNGYRNDDASMIDTLRNGSHTVISGKEASATETQAKFASPKPIAICGMSIRLPGGLHSPQQLWDFLVAKGDARGPVPKSRYNATAYYSDIAKPGSINTEYGYFLDESIDIATVDTSFFTVGKSEVERMDPQQRQMLEVARECMEDAGQTNWKGRPIGCYMGSFGEDWVEIFAKENQQYGLHRVTGYGDFMLSDRVSYEMDLIGPRLVNRCFSQFMSFADQCEKHGGSYWLLSRPCCTARSMFGNIQR